jgi:hypothetical protein
MKKTKYKVPEAPDEIFLYRNDKVYDIMNEGATTFMLDKIEYNDGVQVFVNGAKYPRKGFVTPEAIWSCNVIKRLITFITKFPILFIFVNKQKALQHFNEIGYKLLKHHIMKLNYMTPVAKELHILIKTFLCHYGIDKNTAYETAVIISHLFEYDDAYRFRLQDLFSEVKKEDFVKSPMFTIDFMMLLLDSRDSKEVSDKFKKIAELIFFLNLLPKFRNALDKTIEIMRIENLQYDDGDRYWVSNRNDYKYMGKTFEKRYATIDPKPTGYKMKYE